MIDPLPGLGLSAGHVRLLSPPPNAPSSHTHTMCSDGGAAHLRLQSPVDVSEATLEPSALSAPVGPFAKISCRAWWPIILAARLHAAEIRATPIMVYLIGVGPSSCRVPPDGWLSSIDLETSAEIPRLCSVHGLQRARDSSRRTNIQTISRPFKFDQPRCSSPASPSSPPLPLASPDFVWNYILSTAISARIGRDLTEI